MPIRTRLALLFAITTAVLVAVGGVIFIRVFSAGLTDTVDAALQSELPVAIQAIPDGSGQENFQDSGGHVFGSLSAHGGSSKAGSATQGEYLIQIVDPAGKVVEWSQASGPTRLLGRNALIAIPPYGRYISTHRPNSAEPIRLLISAVAQRPGWVVIVGASLGTTDQAVNRLQSELIFGGGTAIPIAGIAAFVLATAALSPVEGMRKKAEKLSTQDNDARLPVPRTNDEVAALARTMNDLLLRLHTSIHQLSDTVEIQRAFVADASHELRSPLAVLRTELELASKPGRSRDELSETISIASEETQRLVGLANDLLLLAQHDEDRTSAELHRCRVGDLLHEVAEANRGRAAGKSVHLMVSLDSNAEVLADSVKLRRAIENLVDNSLRISPEKSDICLSVSKSGSGMVVIEVGDSGPGFPEEFLPHAFERFSRPDGSRSEKDGGAGLGLSIVQAIAEAHGGTVVAANRPQGGAVVRISLPEAGDCGGQRISLAHG